MDYENFYENQEEATFRLAGSVVLYDGSPVQVVNVENNKDGILRLNIIELPLNADGMNKPTVRKIINSPKFNKFRPFDLGNVNYLYNGEIRVYRVERVPVRTRTQGTTSGNTRISSIGSGREDRAALSWNHLLINEGFVEMCKGVYPSLAEFFKSDAQNAAVSKDLSIMQSESGMANLYHKFDRVGVLNTKGTVFLFPKFKYLKEVIEASRIFSSVNTTIFE